MQTAPEALAAGIEQAARVILFFTEDLKPAEWLQRPCTGANCAAWIVGHLVLSSRGMMTRCGATDLPALPEEFEQRFARDDAAPKSPDYGDISTLRDVFKAHHDRFAAVARGLKIEELGREVMANHPVFSTVGSMLSFAPVHIGTHAGQISTIRRSLGRAPLV